MESRLANVEELDSNVEAWTRQRTPHQVMRMLQSFGVPAGAVQNSEDLFFDLQLRARGHMVQLGPGPYAGITFDGPPIRLATGQKPCTERSPMLGEHNDYVYRELLGMTATEVKELIERRVIF
jgi:crotonobetainyl-CoA:carnitine CoA-transferase CaiB-like acyl-CoA transferase